MNGSFSRGRIYYRLQQFLAVVLILTLAFSDMSTMFNSPYLPTVQEAYAATGDFSIFRDSVGVTSIPTSTEPALDVVWDTTISQNSNIALQANGSDIALNDGGKYFVAYNVWTEQGTSTAGTNRRSQSTWLTIDGAKSPYGWGGGYLRDSGGTEYMYNSGAAIIDTSANATMTVNVRRDDINDAGVNMRSGTNGLSILKLKDGWDYLRIQKTATSSDIDGNTTFTSVDWDASDETDTGSFGFSPTSTDITLKGTDGKHFLITTNVKLNRDSGNTRENYEMALFLDGVEIDGTRVTSYLRGDQNGEEEYHDALVYSGIIAKTSTSDQTLTVRVRRESSGSAGTTVIVGGQTAFSAAALPDTGSYIMLTRDTSLVAAGTQTAIDFTNQNEVDSYAFSHSTSTNPSRVNIDQAGNYLFFSTAYGVNSSNTRQPFRIDWQKNGTTDLNYGSHGAYVRGNQSFSGGSSGGLIMDGLTASDYIEVTQYDEVGTPADLTFSADRISVQGVLLDDNFFGTDVVVSATGTHTTEVDVSTTDVYAGGTFVLSEQTSTRNITNISVTESGTVDGSTGLGNIKLYYDLDTSDPYNCESESYSGTESQYGTTDANGFSGADGVSNFSGSVSISTTQSMCVYVVYDVLATSTDGDTVQLSIDDPSVDVSGSGSPTIGPVIAVAPDGETTLRHAELTQTGYRWLNDDGVEGSATAIENEDVPAIGFANGTTRRLRLQVDAAGSTTSLPTTFSLDYATKTEACSAISSWESVGEAGGDWDMAASSFITDGADSTNIGTGSGGLSDPGGPPTYLSTNGALRDINSTTSVLTLTSNEFLEFEFAIEPTVSAPQGNTYCFRLSDNGTALRNYDTFAEGTISADIDVSASSSQVASLDVGSTDQHVGGQFVVERLGTSRTLTDITLTEVGTIDASADLSNVRLHYDLDTSTPYDCTGESYNGTEPQFGATSTGGFSSANGTSTFSGSVTLNSNQAFCGYVVLDVGSGASDGETIDIQINNPSSDVVVTGSTVGPSTAVSPTGSTTIAGPVLTQTHYHWRNDDGDESDTGASSASGDVEDTPIVNVPKQTTNRLRLQVSNEGTVTSPTTEYQLQYGTKIGTCSEVVSWKVVGGVDAAFDMSLSSHIADGNTTNLTDNAKGAMTDENSSFVGTGALRETEATSSPITLTSTEFTELEYSIEPTLNAGDEVTYCFRVTDLGTPLSTYDSYPELTTRPKLDFFTQRGTATITGTSTTLVSGVDYSPVSASTSAFIRITNTQHTGAGDNLGTGNQNTDDFTAYIEDPENIETSVTIARPAAAINNTRVSWEIIEFVGLAGTDNEMKVRAAGTVSYGGNETTATGSSVSTVVDDEDVVVFVTGQTNEYTQRTQSNDGLSTALWDATNAVPVFTRGEADSVVSDLSYAVVEFTGANWAVQRVEHNYTGTTTETESISPVTSLAQTFIHVQKRVGGGDNGLDEYGHEVYLSSIGAVSFALHPDASTPSAHYSVAWVIENMQTGTGKMTVYRSNGTLGTGGSACGGAEPCTENINIGGTLLTVSGASIFMNNYGEGTGTAYPRTVIANTLISTTQYETWRSDTGQPQTFRTEVVEWPVARVSIRQNYYRLYVDNDALDPTDPWPVGVSDLGENMSLTGSDDPLGEGDRIRLRMTLKINNATLPAETMSFKLQFGKNDTTCSAITGWTDLGDVDSGAVWRGYNTAVTDGVELATSTPAAGTLNISVSDVAGTFEEENNSAVNPYAIDLGEDVEYDWVVEHNGAAQLSDYCFRMVESDDTLLDGYNNYPTIRTTGYTPLIANWRWYDDADSVLPVTPLANENTSPIDISNDNEIKLRVTAAEVEGAPGSNVKFKLQYSELSDFSGAVYDVAASSTCQGQATTTSNIWCYADGAGVDNAFISSSTLSDADSCVGGTGDGCGTHNEAATTTSSLAQPSFSKMEFEFTIRNDGARANAVYYFRLYDVTNDVAVAASSSYPSLQVEGATLTFSVTGLESGTSTAGIVTDVTTSATSVSFSPILIDTDYEAAHRINIDTNATEGYKVLKMASQQLLNSYGSPIDPVTSTNASPAGWSVGCAVEANGCFGYHTTDAVLEEGSARFAASDTYAGLSTSTDEIMYSPIPTNDTHDIIYKLRIGEEQPAGEYVTDITYLAIPIF